MRKKLFIVMTLTTMTSSSHASNFLYYLNPYNWCTTRHSHSLRTVVEDEPVVVTLVNNPLRLHNKPALSSVASVLHPTTPPRSLVAGKSVSPDSPDSAASSVSAASTGLELTTHINPMHDLGAHAPTLKETIRNPELDAYMRSISHDRWTPQTWTKQDTLTTLITTLLTGLLAYCTYADSKVWVNSFFNEYARTDEGFNFQYETTAGSRLTDNLIYGVTAFYALSYCATLYLPNRIASFVGLFVPNKAKAAVIEGYGCTVNAVFNAGVFFTAATKGFLPAYGYYKSSVDGNLPLRGMTLAPFIASWTALESSVRLKQLADRFKTILYGKSYYTSEHKTKIEAINKELEGLQRSVAKLPDDKVVELYHAIQNLSDHSDIAFTENLIGKLRTTIGESVPEAPEVKEKVPARASALLSQTKRKFPSLLGLLVAGFAGVSSFLNAQESGSKFYSKWEGKEINDPTDFNLMMARFWFRKTASYVASNTVYTGDRNDWCGRAFNPANIEFIDTDTVHLLDCPGIPASNIISLYPAEIDPTNLTWPQLPALTDPSTGLIYGDLFYSEEGCNGAFQYFSDDYNSTLSSFQVTPFSSSASAFGDFTGIFSAVGSAVLAAATITRAITLGIDLIDGTPSLPLPGQGSASFNIANVFYSSLNAAFRAMPVGMGAWVLMQRREMTAELGWAIVMAEGLGSMASFFDYFSKGYSEIPGKAQGLYRLAKMIYSQKVGAEMSDTGFSHYKKDFLLNLVIQLRSTVTQSKAKVVDQLHDILLGDIKKVYLAA